VKTKFLIQAAIIGAVYAVLTIGLSAVSYGPVQFRVSEALTVLPAFTPAAVPGLFTGCLVSNLLGPYGIVDAAAGSLATLLAAFLSYKFRKRQLLVPLPPVVANGVIIGAMLHYVYHVPNLLLCMGTVALGEGVICYAVGYPLIRLLNRYRGIFQ